MTANGTVDAAPPAVATPLIRATGVSKAFGAIQALSDVSVEVMPGEVVGLIGANGAGKSTLVKVLTGNHAPDAGTVELAGETISFSGPRAAIAAGIALVPQEFDLVAEQTVAENIFLGALPSRGLFVLGRELRRRAAETLAMLDVDGIAVDAPVATLTPAQQRLVMIARGLAQQPRVLILDEPTASLPIATADRLLTTIARLAERSIGVIYVSHRFAEIQRIADRVVALRNGRFEASVAIGELTTDEMVRLVGGSTEPPPVPTHRTAQNGVTPAVVAERLQGLRVHQATFEVMPGEIVGLAGLEGSGRSELLRLLAGAQRPVSGRLEILGGPACRSSVDARRRGVGYVTEGRRNMLFPTLDVTENATISALEKVSSGGFVLVRRTERQRVRPVLDRMAVKATVDAPILSLSGGNQQKVLIGRWLLKGVRLLLLDEPTIGIDVAARAQIHEQLKQLAAEGMAVIIASMEPEELAQVADRVLILVDGHVRHEFVAPINPDGLVMASYAGK